MDDLLLGGEKNSEDWSQIYEILNALGKAIGLYINKGKSLLITNS